jgi:hypothetical protein
VVDLRSTLRPLVDEPARERLPVAELAERATTRARRLRLRRRRALAGLATVAVVALGGSLAARDDDPDRVTTVHGAEVTPSTTTERDAPSTTSTLPGEGPAPPGTPPPGPTTRDAPVDPGDPGGPADPGDGPTSADPALVVTETTTSDWDGGHCVELRVENTGDAPVAWTVELTPVGAIETLWNARIVAEDGARTTFAGEDWNATLAPRSWTTFGTCLAT